MHVYLAVRTNERTSTTTFAFLLAYYCNSFHQCYSSSPNYRTDNDEAKTATYQKTSSLLETYSTNMGCQQKKRGTYLLCSLLKVVSRFFSLVILRHTLLYTHKLMCQSVCRAKTSRARLLSNDQHQSH